MTAQEAIKILEVARSECEWNAPLEYQGAFDLAIEVLEKQIPKEIVKPESPYFKYACPTCGNYPLSGHYCSECGQAVVYSKEGEG